MPRSTKSPATAFLAFTSANIRRLSLAIAFGASSLTLSCATEDYAPFNPANLTLDDIGTDADGVPGSSASGLVPNTTQLVRLASDTTRCLYVSDDLSNIGNPVLIGKCGATNKANHYTYTSAGEIRNSAGWCIAPYGEQIRVGTPIALVGCDGGTRTRWTYDTGLHLVHSSGACLTVSGITLTTAAKTALGSCISPAPWSQKLYWNTPGTPVSSTPPPTQSPPSTPTPNPTIASVRVSPSANTVGVGDSIRLTPTAYNSSGQPVAATFTWAIQSGATYARLSSAGVVTGLSAGTATISAASAGFIGLATVTVSSSVVTPPPTTTPPPPPSAPPPSGTVPSIPPTLPLAIVDVSWRAPTGKTIAVHAGDNLQNALNLAQRGDEVVIDAGATFTGTFTLPAKAGTSANGWITVRTSAMNSLPPLGGRVSPAHAGAMPKLVAPSVAEVLATAPGASGWRIVGIEMTVSPTLTWVHNGLVLLGDGSLKQTQTSQVPYDIILDRVYVHGQPNGQVKRCVALNSARTAIINSQLLECHGRGFDTQAIGGWNGPGPYLIENNRLEAAGEVIMFGGADPAIPNLVTSDVTIRRNYLYRPMSWKGVWTVKNLFELKNAQRVLVEGNVMENNWVDGQIGFAVMIGSVNQDGKCYWCIVQDVTMRYNLIHNSAGGFDVFERYANAQPVRRVALHHNLLTNIGAAGLGSNGKMFLLPDGVDDIWIEHNTGFAPVTYMTFNSFTKYKNRFTYRNNIGGGATYNLHSAEGMGTAALTKHLAQPYIFAGNVIVGSAFQMPSLNSYPLTMTLVGFISALPLGGTWSLSSLSPYASVGTGGATPGVNWAGLVSQTANVRW